MSGKIPVLVLVFLGLFDILYFRLGLVNRIICYKLSNRGRRKLKEGQTFKEWLFYLRYKSVIPPVMRIEYYCTFALNFIIMIVIVTMWIINQNDNQMMNIGKYYALGMALHFFIDYYIYHCISRNKKDGWNWSSWIDKKKRYNKEIKHKNKNL